MVDWEATFREGWPSIEVSTSLAKPVAAAGTLRLASLLTPGLRDHRPRRGRRDSWSGGFEVASLISPKISTARVRPNTSGAKSPSPALNLSGRDRVTVDRWATAYQGNVGERHVIVAAAFRAAVQRE